MFAAYAPLLLLAFAGECPFAVALARRAPARRILGACLVINLVTHPAAVAAYSGWVAADGSSCWTLGGIAVVPFVVIELAVAVIETIGYRLVAEVTWTTAARIAVVANAATAAMSFLL